MEVVIEHLQDLMKMENVLFIVKKMIGLQKIKMGKEIGVRVKIR